VRTAVDTNVFVALFSGDEHTSNAARIAMEEARGAGLVAISPAVYSELVAGRDAEFVERFISEKDIEVDWEPGRDVWRAAGLRYGEYARTRRRQRPDPGPRRILADFIIGAHAVYFADALLTSDVGIYGTYFSELKIVAPDQLPGDRTGL
jgi:predicted nucleic acid-binding protein